MISERRSNVYYIKTSLTKAPDYYSVTFHDTEGALVGKCYIDTINVKNSPPKEQADFAVNEVLNKFTTLAMDSESLISKQRTENPIQLSGESIRSLIAYVTADRNLTASYSLSDFSLDRPESQQVSLRQYFDRTAQRTKQNESER